MNRTTRTCGTRGCGSALVARWPWPATTIPRGPTFGPLHVCPACDQGAADDKVTNPAYNRHRNGR